VTIWKYKSVEEFYLLGYNAVLSVESQNPTFRRNMPPPSSGSKNKHKKKSVKTDGRQNSAICSSEMSVDF
jgi:hypothetical protein